MNHGLRYTLFAFSSFSFYSFPLFHLKFFELSVFRFYDSSYSSLSSLTPICFNRADRKPKNCPVVPVICLTGDGFYGKLQICQILRLRRLNFRPCILMKECYFVNIPFRLPLMSMRTKYSVNYLPDYDGLISDIIRIRYDYEVPSSMHPPSSIPGSFHSSGAYKAKITKFECSGNVGSDGCSVHGFSLKSL